MSGGKDADTGEETDLLLFYDCGPTAYIAGVAGRNIMSRFFGTEGWIQLCPGV